MSKSRSAAQRRIGGTAKRTNNNRISEDQIRARAYEIYSSSGNESGKELEHWLQAEKELLAKD